MGLLYRKALELNPISYGSHYHYVFSKGQLLVETEPEKTIFHATF